MIPSRPLDFSGILGECIRIIKQTWWRSALIALVCSLPGILLLVNASSVLLTSTENMTTKYVGSGEEHLPMLRDYLFVNTIEPESIAIYRIEFPTLMASFDSVHDALKIKYSDSLSKATLDATADSLAVAVSATHTTLSPSDVLAELSSGLIWLWIAIVILLLGSTAATVANIDIACRSFEQRAMAMGRVISQSFSRWMWLQIIQYCLIGLAMILGLAFVVGIMATISLSFALLGVFFSFGLMIYAIFRMVFAPVALVCENLGPIQAVKRSFSLTQGALWRVVGYTILGFIIMIICSSLIRFPFSFAIRFDDHRVIDLINAVPGSLHGLFVGLGSMLPIYFAITLLAGAITASFFPTFITTFYYEMRTRRDGPLDYYEHTDSPQVAPTNSATETNRLD